MNANILKLGIIGVSFIFMFAMRLRVPIQRNLIAL